MNLEFSFIIPVYNRPNEIDELLFSLTALTYKSSFEVVVIEDGSSLPSKEIIKNYSDKLNISYYTKSNSGPGDSRNFGMKRARGNYFIILDSDCILPKQYLDVVDTSLKSSYVDCYGGPDAAHDSFTSLQKAINYVMTSILTTGGIRGNKNSVDKFQPRSFNMGISKEVFEVTNGFGKIHPGEDPDLTIRIWKAGYQTKLISKAYVFHKRRISWEKFKIQVNKFGKCRPILNSWHPETRKITYWFPTFFCLAVSLALVLIALNVFWPILLIILYLTLIVLDASVKNKSLYIGMLSLIALFIQFYGYGLGFLESTIKIVWLKRIPEKTFPKLFFK